MRPCHPAQPCQLWWMSQNVPLQREIVCQTWLQLLLSTSLAGKAHSSLTCTIPGGIGCHSCIGEQENVETRCEPGGWIAHRLKGDIWWTAMSGELLRELGLWWCVYLVHAYHRPLLTVLWFDDCDEEKGEAQGSKTEILKGGFSFALLPGLPRDLGLTDIQHAVRDCSFVCNLTWNGTTRSEWGAQLYDSIGSAIHHVWRNCRRSLLYLCFGIFGPLLTKLPG